MRKNNRIKRILGSALAVGLAATLSLGGVPGVAWAYFSKPAPSISVAGGVSVASGSSTTIACTVSPEAESQLPGCGMAECPQACDGLVKPGDSKPGGCLDANGWCTCAGTGYYTAYTSVQVSSSDPSVARASYASGVLSIVGYRPGTATISISASLSKHAPSAASTTVTVYDNATTPSNPSNNGGSPSGSGSGAPSGGTVSVTAVGGTTAIAAAAAAAAASGGEKQVVEMEAEDGSKTIVVEAEDAATAAEELGKIVGTNGTVTFWSGGALGSPAISWTFKGEDIAEDADLNIDPTVTVSKRGTGDVSKLMADVDKAIVMDFAHSGDLPAPAEVFVRASDVFSDGDELSLFTYNEDSQKFERVEDGVKVADGYATFTIDHCSVWALSEDDLTKLEMPAGDSAAPTDATQVDVHAQSGTPYVVALAIAVVVVVAAVAAVVVVRRKKAAALAGAAEQDASADADNVVESAADNAGGGEK